MQTNDRREAYAEFILRLKELIEEAKRCGYSVEAISELHVPLGLFVGEFRRRYPNSLL